MPLDRPTARPIDPDVRRLALSCLLLGFVGPTPPRVAAGGRLATGSAESCCSARTSATAAVSAR